MEVVTKLGKFGEDRKVRLFLAKWTCGLKDGKRLTHPGQFILRINLCKAIIKVTHQWKSYPVQNSYPEHRIYPNVRGNQIFFSKLFAV